MAMKGKPVPFERVPQGTQWPSGDSIDVAILPISVDQVVSILGFPLFEGVEEGFGPWLATGLRFTSGTVVEIINYVDRPGPTGFILRVDVASDVDIALDEAISVFSIIRANLPWISPRVGLQRKVRLITLSLEKPENGWLPVTVKTDTASVEFVGSYTPRNSVQELVEVLAEVASGGNGVVVWNLEPDQYKFEFSTQRELAELQIFFVPHAKRIAPTLVLTATGTKAQILLPFWRTLRKLEASEISLTDWPRIDFRLLKLLKMQLK